MDLRLAGTLVAVAAVLAGCQTVTGGRSPVCNDNVCHIDVKVVDCAVTADPPTLTVSGRDRELHWDLDGDSAGYRFARNGIAFDDDPKQEFTNLHAAEQDRKFVGKDRNTFPQKYKYTIRVMKGALACAPYDPWIVNN